MGDVMQVIQQHSRPAAQVPWHLQPPRGPAFSGAKARNESAVTKMGESLEKYDEETSRKL
jgi:hypothetical protein